MIVADAVKLMEDELDLGHQWFRTHEKVMRTIDIIHQLKNVNQKLVVEKFEVRRNVFMPEIYIVIDGRYHKGVT